MAGNVGKTDSLKLLWADEFLFRDNLDRSPFCLAHALSDHPLFELPRLFKLADALKRHPNCVAYDAGDVRVEQRWNQRPASQYTLEEAMERIECTGAWVILKHIELDSEYRALMEGIMSDVQSMSGKDLRKVTRNLEAQIMVTSPGRVTPYHLDNECNMLLQIKGEKDLFVFDQTDRQILTEIELERFWIGDWNAGEYKARCQERAHTFRLAPGKAVHIPVNAPHWVKNDANVSVSFSTNFEWRDESVPNVYRANFFLRKLGIQPTPPGKSGLIDAVKKNVIAAGFVPAINTARGTVRLIRRLRRRDPQKPGKKPAMA